MRVTDINPGTGSAFPAMGTVMNGYLYFSANDGSHGWQIWRYPVSGGTAERVTDIDGGTSGADPMWLTAVDGTLFFSANTPAAGRELWQSNGLPLSDPGTATALVADIYSGPLSSNPNYATAAMVDTDQKYQLTMATIGDWVYFPADDGTGYSLWRSNGTITEKLGSSQPRLLTPVSWIENNQARDMLLYVASTEAEGCELWKFDPSLWPPTPKRSVGPDVPVSFVLARNYPNPFNPTTVVEYRIPESGLVTLSVSDIHGRNVATLVDGWRPAGVSSVVFDASGLPAGTYICTLQTPGTKLRHKMSLVK
jgi:ELWxxDGT repeat protein